MKAKSICLVGLMSVAALCAFTGSADDPFAPFNLPYIPPSDPGEERVPDTDPIIHLISDFMLSTAPPSAATRSPRWRSGRA